MGTDVSFCARVRMQRDNFEGIVLKRTPEGGRRYTYEPLFTGDDALRGDEVRSHFANHKRVIEHFRTTARKVAVLGKGLHIMAKSEVPARVIGAEYWREAIE